NLIRRPHGKWSLQLVLEPTADAPFEIQAGLSDASRKLTETWSYLCPITPPSYEFPQVYTRNE
ncbi:MAG TPA: glucan biosynthesis protein G, partial [Planctomycetaceae bacterium]|nr:glucan biosynthesis protein G [Planctomycetaceae bacterium]